MLTKHRPGFVVMVLLKSECITSLLFVVNRTMKPAALEPKPDSFAIFFGH